MIVTANRIPVPDPIAPDKWDKLMIVDYINCVSVQIRYQSSLNTVQIELMYRAMYVVPGYTSVITYLRSQRVRRELQYRDHRMQQQWGCICWVREPCSSHDVLSSTSAGLSAVLLRPENISDKLTMKPSIGLKFVPKTIVHWYKLKYENN